MNTTLENPWEVREEDFPWYDAPADKLKFLLNYAVLAPSIYNTQPWVFRVAGPEAEIYADRSRALPSSDPRGRHLIMSVGAALFHLRVSIRQFGYDAVVRSFPDLDVPDLVACVRLGRAKETTLEEHRLFMAIKKRVTSRGAFQSRPISTALLEDLREAARREGATLFVINDEKRLDSLEIALREARVRRLSDPRFQAEQATWTHQNGHAVFDGMPGHPATNGLPVNGSLTTNGEAATYVVLATNADNPFSWLTAGQALSRVLLTGADYGLSARFMNDPVAYAPLRERVAGLLGGTHQPQIILRIGYGHDRPSSPRRPVQSVISNAWPVV